MLSTGCKSGGVAGGTRPGALRTPYRLAWWPPGLDILLVAVSQRGTSSRHRTRTTLAAACDDGGELVRRCAASGRPMLAKVDPYGDLVLTSSEMEQLIDELRSSDIPRHGAASRVVHETLELAARGAVEPATELHFVGDQHTAQVRFEPLSVRPTLRR